MCNETASKQHKNGYGIVFEGTGYDMDMLVGVTFYVHHHLLFSPLITSNLQFPMMLLQLTMLMLVN